MKNSEYLYAPIVGLKTKKYVCYNIDNTEKIFS